MFLLPTHQCSERPGRSCRWLILAAFVATLSGLGFQTVSAQVSVGRAASCPGGAAAVGDLGVDLDCQDCELSYRASSRSWRWRFRSEPTIKHVGASGPSRGKLRSGDVFVSIDGRLITTRSGGARLADLKPGEPVTVSVRRNGRDVTTEITPAAACPTDAAMAVGYVPPTPPSPPAPPVIVSVAEPVRPPTAPWSIARGVAGVLAVSPSTLSGTKAWFGFGLSCSDCKFYPLRHEEIAAAEAQLKARTQGNNDPGQVRGLYRELESYRREGSRWEFSENPRVFSVDEDGPADRAGLRRGDILTHIDGLALLSDEGGKRLGQAKSGDEVEFVYRRGTTVGTAKLTAAREPTVRGLATGRSYSRSLALLERSLSRIERTTDAEVRAEVALLQNQLREAEVVRLEATQQVIRDLRVRTRPLRYSGTIAKVNITVVSHGSVVVSRDETTGEIVITTSDATIRVKPED
ncbi:MAG: PDZ domain-containing protein [Gemmatimonadales bacterium]